MLSNDVISLVCDDIVPSAAVTLVVSPPIALAFALILVLAFVIEEFKEVIFTEVDISASSLTPATNNMLLAF